MFGKSRRTREDFTHPHRPPARRALERVVWYQRSAVCAHHVPLHLIARSISLNYVIARATRNFRQLMAVARVSLLCYTGSRNLGAGGLSESRRSDTLRRLSAWLCVDFGGVVCFVRPRTGAPAGPAGKARPSPSRSRQSSFLRKLFHLPRPRRIRRERPQSPR